MLRNFVLETANAPGTATTVTLAGAPSGRLTFASQFTTGAKAFYFMDDGAQQEWGYGTFTAGTPNQFSRDVVTKNSAGGTARLNFTGTVRIYNDIPAEHNLWLDTAGALTLATGVRSTGYDAGGANFRAAAGSYGLIIRNDGASAYVLLTNAGDSLGSFNSLRPLTVALGTGCMMAGDPAANWTTDGIFSAIGTPGVAGKKWALSAWSQNVGTSGGGAFIVRVDRTDAPMTNYFFGAAQVGSVTTNGTSTSFNTTSDYRLKATFGSADGSLIGRVRVYDAEFKANPGERYPMVLAHELAAVAPFAVTGEKDAVDADGQIIPQQVDTSKLIPALIAYVQRLERRVAELESR